MKTIMSAKGQVVVPQELRRRFNWEAGKALEVIPLADGLTLRAITTHAFRPPDEIFAELGAIRPNSGAMVTDEEVHNLVVAEAIRSYDFGR